MVNILKAFNRTGSFWVGASDFERGQRFTWFNNGSELMLEELDVMPEEDKDQRCIQVRELNISPPLPLSSTDWVWALDLIGILERLGTATCVVKNAKQ